MLSAYAQDGRLLVPKVRIAKTHWEKFRGLMLSRLEPDEALLIPDCSAIHCCFMLMPIDVLFLSRSGYVEHLIPAMKPWTFSKVVPRASQVLECYPGLIEQHQLRRGQFVAIQSRGK